MMSAIGPCVASALLCLSPPELERQAAAHVSQQFEHLGRTSPAMDPPLSKAARALAQRALDSGTANAANLVAVSQAVSDAQGHDPNPRVLVLRGSPPEQTLASLRAREDLSSEAASQLGIGAAIHGEYSAVVVLLATRKVALKPFPRTLKPGGSATLCGQMLRSLPAADVFITRPDGEVEKVPLRMEDEARFCSNIRFSLAGRYSVEIVGRGAEGPEVAGLFFVEAGAAGERPPQPHIAEPTSLPEARSSILGRVNALRKAHGLSLVERDEALDNVAQAYSERMASQHFFAHVAPDGTDLPNRLRRGGYNYHAAGENLGLAPGPLAAHFCIEQSPGHLRNLIDARYARLGIGIAYEKSAEGAQAIVTEILADAGSKDPIQDAYRSLQEARASLRLPALRRSQVLEQIALEHAKRALELGEPKMQLPGMPLEDRVFAALKDIRSASVDFFISDSPGAIPRSKNLTRRGNDLVGVGAVRGDSARYGKNKYWVVVIYAAPK
jgi:uncharacterized protein YkwD